MGNAPDKPNTTDPRTSTPLLLDAKAVAELLSISRRTIFRLSSSGKLGPMPIALGGRKLWRSEELTAWIRAGCPRRELWLKMAEEQGFGRQFRRMI